MKLLDGREVAGFIKERHGRIAAALPRAPKLVIVRTGDDAATDRYLGAKRSYGEDIGVTVEVCTSKPTELLADIKRLSADSATTGLIVQLPLAGPEQTDAAIAAIAPAKDVDGLRAGSEFEAATPKAILWLLAAYNVDLRDKVIAVVGQGRLVGKPLADRLEASNYQIARLDDTTHDLVGRLQTADIIVTATGQAGLITSAMVGPGAVVVDTGSPAPELAADLLARDDLTRTPNPGGVGPMTVAALFDNLLIAAQNES